MSEPIEMSFGLGHIHVGRSNYEVDGGAHLRLLVNTNECRPRLQWVGSAKTAEPIEMPFRGLTHAGSRNNVLVLIK